MWFCDYFTSISLLSKAVNRLPRIYNNKLKFPPFLGFCLPPTLPMSHLASCLTLTGRPCVLLMCFINCLLWTNKNDDDDDDRWWWLLTYWLLVMNKLRSKCSSDGGVLRGCPCAARLVGGKNLGLFNQLWVTLLFALPIVVYYLVNKVDH